VLSLQAAGVCFAFEKKAGELGSFSAPLAAQLAAARVRYFHPINFLENSAELSGQG
jgi:hypothetical protein